MVKARSGSGGGLRDNRRWGGGGAAAQDGYAMYSSNDQIEAAMGLGNGGQADRWAEKLTPWEENAVKWYTGNGHRQINEFERLGKHDKMPAEQLMKFSDSLESAIDKGRLDKRMVVNRTSSADLLGGAHTVADLRKMYGQTFTDKGFMSSEINLANSLANPYGSKHGAEQIYMHIKVPKGEGIGQYVRGLSNANQEQEFLFNRGSSFKLVGAYQDAAGHVHANLKYVGRNVK